MIRSFLIALALSASAARAQDVTFGGALYASFCASCHGAEGRGDGPMATVLSARPTNLTRLAIGNGGVFPTTDIVRQIDGRDPMLPHGGVMPLFGAYFEGRDTPLRAETGQPILTSGPIADLVAWLESIQK